MQVAILTAFPSMFEGPFAEGMIRIARETGQLEVRIIDYRDFTTDVHRTIDDAPFGGGAGMILKPEPLVAALGRADTELGARAHRILLGPQGRRFDQAMARETAERPRVALIAGRYKDVDDRIRRQIDDEVSIGDYVLSGGELAAMVIVDAVARLLPGVVGDRDSVDTDSFEGNRLDAPYYTRPASFRGEDVPEVLRSGHHEQIARWRRKEGLRRTLIWRPDLLTGGVSEEEQALLREILDETREVVEGLRSSDDPMSDTSTDASGNRPSEEDRP